MFNFLKKLYRPEPFFIPPAPHPDDINEAFEKMNKAYNALKAEDVNIAIEDNKDVD